MLYNTNVLANLKSCSLILLINNKSGEEKRNEMVNSSSGCRLFFTCPQHFKVCPSCELLRVNKSSLLYSFFQRTGLVLSPCRINISSAQTLDRRLTGPAVQS